MMITLYLIAVAALLPCLLCQDVLNDPLCQNMICPANQVCRHIKPCGPRENCNITSTCSPVRPSRGGCLHGDPVLHLQNGRHVDLTCYNEAPCPRNGYCSTVLADISSVCCLSDTVVTVRPGMCPRFKPDPSKFWCVDECKSDGDCHMDSKCCHTGCSKECVYIPPVTPPSPIDLFKSSPRPGPALVDPSTNYGDPCAGKVCPAGQTCRHYKPCGQLENCLVTAICTATPALRGGCMFGSPVLFNKNGRDEDLTCYPAAPCPSNAYCSTELQDVAAVCCLSDPAQTVRGDMTCPVSEPDPSRFWCVDGCKSDGDCRPFSKCCSTGCSKECVPGKVSALSPIRTTFRPPAPSSMSSDPCTGMICPAGQICRHFKPCGLTETCNVTGVCSGNRSDRGGCRHGMPVLFNQKGREQMLSCWREAPCPSNAYCSTELMDTSSRCCLADPAQTVKPGVCPAPITDPTQRTNPYFCYDQCRYDGDCAWSQKCCNTGCKLECVGPKTVIQPPIVNPTPPPRDLYTAVPGKEVLDPCLNKVCPSGQKCRYFKPCGLKENCNVTSICTAERTGEYGCSHGSAVLFNNNNKLKMLSCWKEAPCPSNAYCSTVLMDTSSRCCLADPDRKVKPGFCPSPNSRTYKTNPNFCYDECKHDGDCSWNDKCCNTGCKMECTIPESQVSLMTTQPPLPTPPVWPPAYSDPCDFKLCPANTYCRRRGQPCRHEWSCRPEGTCNRCPYLPLIGLRSSSYRLGHDPNGCLVIMHRQASFAPGFGRRRSNTKINPLTLMLLSEYFN